MGSAFKILTIRGIAIRVHITFPLILIWAAIQFGFLADAGLAGALFGVIVVTILFVIVTLHELGHSVAAQYYGVPVKDITLLPIGGVAQLREIPESPIKEFVIAIAGPAVNFIIAAIMFALAVVFDLGLENPLATVRNLDEITFANIYLYTFVYNLGLGIFNLIPAFPMDGGRILRAVLAAFLPYTRATQIASTIGRGLAWVFGLYGFLNGEYFLILIAFFIYMGASQENSMAQLRGVLRGVSVARAFSHPVQTLTTASSLQDAADLVLSSFQTSFPVVEGGRLVGIVTYPRLIEALREHDGDAQIGLAMARDVPFVTPMTELVEAQQLLAESRIDALPVMEQERFVGLITSRDISEIYRLLTVDPDLLLGRVA